MAQARKYIYDSLGADFLEASVLDLEIILDESESGVPLICLLSTGSDPSAQIEAMAKSRAQECKSLALGQGQEEIARRMLNEGLQNGNWLLLQNCHLSLSFCDEIYCPRSIMIDHLANLDKRYHKSPGCFLL